jgi:hypothetical protein
MPSPGHWVSAGTLALNCGATNAAPAQKDQSLLSSKRRPNFKTHVALEGKNIWSRVRAGIKTKSDCAGEGQLQITAVTETDYKARVA